MSGIKAFLQHGPAISGMLCSILVAHSCLYPWPWLRSGDIASTSILNLELIGAIAVMGT